MCAGSGLLGPYPSTYHIFYDFILPILPLHLQQVVAEVKEVKAPLLSKENNDRATCPVQTISKALPGGEDRTELGKISPTMIPGTFLGGGKSDSVLFLESGYTPRENELRRPAELHQDQRMVHHIVRRMRTLPLTWVVPIHPFPSARYLGHVTLYCSSPQLFRWEAFGASVYVYAQQSPVLRSPCSPSTSLLAEATAAAEGIPGAVSPRYLMSGANGRAARWTLTLQ